MKPLIVKFIVGIILTFLLIIPMAAADYSPISDPQQDGPTPDILLSNVTWDPPVNISLLPGGNQGSNEPGAAMHPINQSWAIVGGNSSDPTSMTRIENTNDRGITWGRQREPSNSSIGDGVPVWLAANTVSPSALFASISRVGSFDTLQLGKSTDAGFTWLTVNSNINVSGVHNDREYLWTDHNSCSIYYGRTYLTESLVNGLAYRTVAVRWSTDDGTTWSTPQALVDSGEAAPGASNPNFNQDLSLAIQPGGGIVALWHRGRCCEEVIPSIDVSSKIMWSRSTDGGVTFPISGTVYTIPRLQSIPTDAISPGGFRWGDIPNIAADPIDGTLYAVWAAYRSTIGDPTTAAVYLSRGTPDATSWTAPIVVSPNYPSNYQFMPWVQVSHDHTVHVTFGANAPLETDPHRVAAYYVQSTDRGQTFSSFPTQLSNGIFTVSSNFIGDYQAASVGGYTGSTETILATWTEVDGAGGKDRWGRFGTIALTTPTPTPCGPITNYTYTQATGAAIIAAATDTNNHCDNCVTTINLPFPYTIYGQTYNGVTVSDNGTLQFGSGNATPNTTCLPAPSFNYSIFAHWHDLATTALSINYPCPGCGIYTSISGVTPNQIFNIKWVTCWVVDGECLSSASGYPTFEVRLYEGQNKFELIYGAVPSTDGIENLDAVVGVQKDDRSLYTSFTCSSGLTTQGLKLTFTQACPALTPSSCAIQFQDVPSSNTFYPYIRCLACRGIINGYPCGGVGEPCTCPDGFPYFRPNNNVTRAQVSKMVSSSAGFSDFPPSRTFEDIPTGDPFYFYIERLAIRGYISGYPCGQYPQEPCVPPSNRPYFRPGNPVTRGQLAKIVANAAGYSETPTSQTFEDVPSSNTFYPFVERIALRGIIAGYPCGGPFEPCQPGNRPYFRPNNNSTRGQTAKIVSQAFFPNCQTLGDMTDTPNNSMPKVPVSPTAPPGRTVTPAPTYTTPTPWLPSPVPTVLLPSPVPTVPAPTIPVPTAAVP